MTSVIYAGITHEDVANVRGALLSHVHATGLKVAAVPVDSNGRALLSAGGEFQQLIQATIDKAPMRQAALAIAALASADPFTSMLLGGEPVVEAARSLLESRAAATNKTVAEHLAERDAADNVLLVLKGDSSSAYVAAHKAALGRPPPDQARAAS